MAANRHRRRHVSRKPAINGEKCEEIYQRTMKAMAGVMKTAIENGVMAVMAYVIKEKHRQPKPISAQ